MRLYAVRMHLAIGWPLLKAKGRSRRPGAGYLFVQAINPVLPFAFEVNLHGAEKSKASARWKVVPST